MVGLASGRPSAASLLAPSAGWDRSQGFPRFTGRWGNDRPPEDATTVEEVVSIFRTALRAPTSA